MKANKRKAQWVITHDGLWFRQRGAVTSCYRCLTKRRATRVMRDVGGEFEIMRIGNDRRVKVYGFNSFRPINYDSKYLAKEFNHVG